MWDPGLPLRSFVCDLRVVPSLQSPVLFLRRALGSGFLSSCAPSGVESKVPSLALGSEEIRGCPFRGWTCSKGAGLGVWHEGGRDLLIDSQPRSLSFPSQNPRPPRNSGYVSYLYHGIWVGPFIC